MPKIMAVTVQQPYASAIALGYKSLETRDWMPQYRGALVIHAGKVLDTTVIARPDLMEFFHLVGVSLFKLPLGAAVCICDLHAVYRTEDLEGKISDQERMFGNYAPGRSAWHLKNVRAFNPPIKARGQQGLWKWTLPIPPEGGWSDV